MNNNTKAVDVLTKAQISALVRARDFGNAWLMDRNNSLGASASRIRMVDSLVSRGLLTRYPNKLTDAGRAALSRIGSDS